MQVLLLHFPSQLFALAVQDTFALKFITFGANFHRISEQLSIVCPAIVCWAEARRPGRTGSLCRPWRKGVMTHISLYSEPRLDIRRQRVKNVWRLTHIIQAGWGVDVCWAQVVMQSWVGQEFWWTTTAWLNLRVVNNGSLFYARVDALPFGVPYGGHNGWPSVCHVGVCVCALTVRPGRTLAVTVFVLAGGR